MAKSSSTPIQTKIQRMVSFFRDERTRVVMGLVILLGGVFITASMLSFLGSGTHDYDLLQQSFDQSVAQVSHGDKGFNNVCGYAGARLANFMFNHLFGVASFFLAFFVLSLGYRIMNVETQYSLFRHGVTCVFFTVWLSLLLSFVYPVSDLLPHIRLGGAHGNVLALYLRNMLGHTGVGLLLGGTLLIFLIVAFVSALDKIKRIVRYPYFRNLSRFLLSLHPTPAPPVAVPSVPEEAQQVPSIESFTPLEEDSESEDAPQEENRPAPITTAESTPPTTTIPTEQEPIEPMEEISFQVATATGGEEAETLEKPLSPLEKYGKYDPTLDLSHYQYPGFDLLKAYEIVASINQEEQQNNKNKIIETLRTYGVAITNITATVGPTITLYEIVPDAGVRISKVRSLSDDIALSLAADGVRIIAPMPGKGTIGIEVPNQRKQIVPMRDIIASKKFQECTYDLPIALGKTITGEIYMADLCKMPHLLVAGATGQGKSVGLNAIITSLLYKKHPAQLKMVLVDPKKLEFSIYAHIDHHFLAKLPDNEDAVITDVTKVVQTLKSLCKEMDDRYDLLKKAHVRTIKEYNTKFVHRELNPQHGHRYLPYFVIVIDEFGDLIMTAGKDIELPIARIAQLARAAGMHMIIATQRPTTNIITGTIKANFPARIAFKTASAIDSRTILDAAGSDKLIGKGDMLINYNSELTRVQCALVDTPEVEQVCHFIGDQPGYPEVFPLPEVELVSDAAANIDLSSAGSDGCGRDPLFNEAARLIVIHQQGSTSLIQRKFSIGYTRAGRMMDQLETAGIVGPNEGGGRPRQVLVQDEIQLEKILNEE